MQRWRMRRAGQCRGWAIYDAIGAGIEPPLG